MDPLQDKLLAPLDRVLDKVRPLGQDDMVPHQDRLQAVGQVSPLEIGRASCRERVYVLV